MFQFFEKLLEEQILEPKCPLLSLEKKRPTENGQEGSRGGEETRGTRGEGHCRVLINCSSWCSTSRTGGELRTSFAGVLLGKDENWESE